MRIGLVRRGYSPTGGAESYLRGFAEAAVSGGHEIVLFASETWPDWSWGEQVIASGKSPASFSKALETLHPHGKCEVLFSLERISNCDVYRAGDGVHAAWLERRARISSLWKRWSFGFNPKHRALIQLEKKVMQSARHIIANSKMVRDEIESFHGKSAAAKVHVVRNGINAEKWARPTMSRSEFRKKYQLPQQEKIAVFVGSGWDRKGLAYAIESTRLAGCRLLVSGKGSLKHLPSHVRVLGPVKNVVDVLHAADAFILPTFYDPFSNASLEALAAGLPVITTKFNGVSEILDPLTDGGVVESPDDVAGLSTALCKWLDDPQSALRREHAAVFSIERNLAETLHIIAS